MSLCDTHTINTLLANRTIRVAENNDSRFFEMILIILEMCFVSLDPDRRHNFSTKNYSPDPHLK